MPRPHSTIETRRCLQEQDPKWFLKVCLRIAATVFAFVCAIMFSFSVAKTLHLNNPYFEALDGDFSDELPLAPALLSLLYNPFSVMVLIHIRQGKRIHPGWHVAMDFIIWGLCVPSITFAAWDGWFIWWQPFYPEYDYDGIYGCADQNIFSEKCSPMIYTLGRMEIAGCVCLGFIWLFHLILFVMACIDLWKLRKSAKSSQGERYVNELQQIRSPENAMITHPPPSYSASTRAARSKDVERGKKIACPDCNLPGLGCCER